MTARFSAHATVSSADLAAVIGRDERRVQQLEAESIFRNVGKGRAKRFVLSDAVQAWVEYAIRSEIDRSKDRSPDKSGFEAERTRKLKLENDAREGLLIETPDAIAAIDAIVGILRTELAAVPARISEDVATRRLVENAIDGVLGNLSARFAKAGADLRAGRDPLAADDEASA